MATYICEICGKKSSVGSSQRHRRGVAGKRWMKRAPKTRRVFKPNLQRVTLNIAGEIKKMRICAKCIKRIKKYGSIKDFKKISVV
ncbi:bL28 family ribosomal protein [Patescibacteria group bacterium]